MTQPEPLRRHHLEQRVEEVAKRYADDADVQDLCAELTATLEKLQESSGQVVGQTDERRPANADLSLERALWRGFVDLVPDALVVTNKAGLILEFNGRARDQLGLKPPGHHPMLLALRFGQSYRPTILRMLRNPVGVGGEALSVTVDANDDSAGFGGELRCGLVGANRVLWLLHDTSTARHAHRMLESAIVEERKVADQLRMVDAVRRAFLLGVSHDLRAPVAAVAGLASLLRDRSLDPQEQDKVISQLEDTARATVTMLRELLDSQRIEDAATPAQRRPIDVASVVSRAGSLIDLDGHHLELQLVPTQANADGVIIERITTNLVRNAVQHTPAGTTIWVRCRREPDGVLLVVEDDGPGIPADRRRVIFDPFLPNRRLQGSSGLGVGLVLVRRFSQLHGGYARVEERPGGGASFHVLLAA
jgi:signal transduction histidine kinase